MIAQGRATCWTRVIDLYDPYRGMVWKECSVLFCTHGGNVGACQIGQKPEFELGLGKGAFNRFGYVRKSFSRWVFAEQKACVWFPERRGRYW